jgi:hypothetical protein
MAFLEVEEIKNDGRTYQIGLEEIGFIKGKIIKSGNEVDGVPLTFTPKFDLIVYSSTRKFNMNFLSIYYESKTYGLTQFGVISNILAEKGLNGLIAYVKKLNQKVMVENKNDISTSTNKELARIHLDFI